MPKQPRPKSLPDVTQRINTGCGHLYVTVTFQNGLPFEVFGDLGKAGGCSKAQSEGLTRCVTLGLRHGIPIEEFIKQLAGIECQSQVWDEGQQVKSCPHAIALCIQRILKELPHEGTSVERLAEVIGYDLQHRPDPVRRAEDGGVPSC